MRSQPVHFENAEGHRLSARLELPLHGPTLGCAVFAHCFTCSKNLKAVGHISDALAAQGIAVLRFDFTGLGQSEGDFADTNFSSNVADLVAAARFMEATYEAPALLIGHSLGGAAVLQAVAELPEIRAVATIGAPADPAHVVHLIEDSRAEIEARGEAEVVLGGRRFRIRKQFLDDLEASRMQETLRALKRPLLILHSPVDNTVGVENAAALFKAARHPKSFVSLDHADHLLTDEADSRYVGAVIAAWAKRYIAPHQAEPEDELEDDRVVARTGPSGYRTEIMAGAHHLVADEPVAVGGTDTGPTPYDLLSAALGACTSMTLRMYADRKEWPLEEVVVRLAHKKIYAEDCKTCGEEGGKIDHIDRELELTGELDEAQITRLLEIADRCPVHRTLHGDVRVETTLRSAE